LIPDLSGSPLQRVSRRAAGDTGGGTTKPQVC
jgi:hypothetical protein